jgi:hypothetical protein
MSREDPVIYRIRAAANRRSPEEKRAYRDADVVIDGDDMVIKDRYGPGLGRRAATAAEKRKARTP